MKRRPKSKPIPMGEVLPGVLSDLGLGAAATAARISEVWSEIVGAEAAVHSWPAALRGGVLDVEVDSSVWAQQLQLRRTALLGDLSRRLEAEAPTDLRFSVGRSGGAAAPR
jgi:predicted nucleic acid-binding Zn ribbon protein